MTFGDLTEASRFANYTHALVVGVSDYGNKGLHDLPSCEPEAAAIVDALVNKTGCGVPKEQVLHLSQASISRASILRAIASLSESLGPSDLFFFYFAGHGLDADDGFVLCTGASDSDFGVSGWELNEVLGRLRCRGVLIIVDCCGGAAIAEHAPNFLYRLDHSNFRLFISASRSGQSSWELPDGRGSLFTHHLLDALKGKVSFRTRGEIFFTDLFDFLHTAVQSSAQAAFGDLNIQEPVFSGSYTRDPLLFLNKEISLRSIKIRTERITRAHLYRQLTFAVIATVVTVLVAIGSYWTFLESQQYLMIEQDTIKLVHGYPNMSGFGLPRTEWIYPLGPEDLQAGKGLRIGQSLVMARAENPDGALLSVLSPTSLVKALLWNDELGRARSIFRENPGRFLDAKNGKELLPELITKKDWDWILKVIRGSNRDQEIALIKAMAKIDQEIAAIMLSESTVSDSIGAQFDLLGVWQKPCVESLQSWMTSFLSDRDAAWTIPALAQLAVRTGCKFPTEPLFFVSPEYLESVIFALRLTNAEQLSDIEGQIASELRNDVKSDLPITDPALPAKHRMLAARMMTVSRYMENIPCIPELIDLFRSDVFDPLDRSGRLNALAAVNKHCDSTDIKIETDAAALHVLFSIQGRGPSEVLYIDLLDFDNDILTTIDTLEEANASGVIEAMRAVMVKTNSPELRLQIVERLRRRGADGTDALDFLLPNHSDLETAILRWLAASNPKRAFSQIREGIVERGDEHYIDALVFLEPNLSERKRLIREVSESSRFIRTATSALIGDSKGVAKLFDDPDSEVREVAALYAPLNRLWEQFHSSLPRERFRYDPYYQMAVERTEGARMLTESLAAMPLWARPWRAKFIGLYEISDEGVDLLFRRQNDVAIAE